MKTCPICHKTYPDDNLNFCLNDGGVLQFREDNFPPTVIMEQPRETTPTLTGYQEPTYENQQIKPYQSFGIQGLPQFPIRALDQTLPTISLVLGVLGLVLFCCLGGIPFGIIATILGYIGLRNANQKPHEYGGKNIALAGIIVGIVGFILSVLYWLFVALSG